MALEVYDLRVRVNCGGQHAECVFNFRVDNISSIEDFTVAEQMRLALDDGPPGTSWMSRFRACLSEEAFISSVATRRFDPSGGNSSPQAFEPTDLPGTQAFEINTQQIAGCLIWIGADEPARTGRTFMPGVPENFLESSRWTEDGQNYYETFIGRHITGLSIATGQCDPVIYTRATTVHQLIQNGYLSQKPGTQRRREKPI